MIKSKYVSGAKIPAFDSAVDDLLAEVIDGGGNEMVIAIENTEKQIYRVVKTYGMGAYINVVHDLADIGLYDTLANSTSGKNGYDSWFIATDAMINSMQAPVVEPVDAVTEIFAELDSIPETERTAVLKSRIGQGIFRERLINYWKGCAVTGADYVSVLRASHIKPWRDSSNVERLDQFNGLLLTPNLDSAFDAGYVSFDNHGKILLSSKFSGAPAFQLYITHKLKLNAKLLTDAHRKYLEHHREFVFLD